MHPIGETVFADLTETIVHEIKPQQIILFGSYARGTAGPDSDIDLLIIVEQPFSASRSPTSNDDAIVASLSPHCGSEGSALI